MNTPKRAARISKPQDEKKQPDRDIGPERLHDQNIGARKVDGLSPKTAADFKDLTEVLSTFQRDELAQIPVVPTGVRLKQGAVYLDLDNPRSGAITATGEWKAETENRYVPKAEMPYEYWNRLLEVFSLQGNGEDAAVQLQNPEELIDKTLADSFPASDPPSWNMGEDTEAPAQARATSEPKKRG
jgi:hypothetical protein